VAFRRFERNRVKTGEPGGKADEPSKKSLKGGKKGTPRTKSRKLALGHLMTHLKGRVCRGPTRVTRTQTRAGEGLHRWEASTYRSEGVLPVLVVAYSRRRKSLFRERPIAKKKGKVPGLPKNTGAGESESGGSPFRKQAGAFPNVSPNRELFSQPRRKWELCQEKKIAPRGHLRLG